MYAELHVTTNFSFLRGSSHPQEIVWRAAELGYRAVAITDFNTLAGIVRAHTAAKEAGIQLVIGCRVETEFSGSVSCSIDERRESHFRSSLLVYPKDRKSYGALCRLLTAGKLRVAKNDCFLALEDFLPLQNSFVTIAVPPFFQSKRHTNAAIMNAQSVAFHELCNVLAQNSTDRSLLSVALTQNYAPSNNHYVHTVLQTARSLKISTIATNDVYYHVPERRPLQDALTCIREKCTIQQAGFKLFQNAERYLKPVEEMERLFRDIPGAVRRTLEVSEICAGFSLDLLKYNYPDEICPAGLSVQEHLRECTMKGAALRYPDGIPEKVVATLEEEFSLIRELEYEKYFLTCYDIVRFARSRGILCQGRGAAANSAVCYCLGITSVDPHEIDLLFARFISKERKEPPDIDIDFEHERREEVIQYIYGRYGRERAALTAEVVTYRPRSAVREIGKALGLSLEIVDKLAKSVHRWTDCRITAEMLREIGLDPFDSTVQNALVLSNEISGFPRHLSQHVGGFIISQDPLCEIVPILNAGMENRTIIEWDKNDIEELGMLKIDVLGLGMLTCIRKALELVNRRTDIAAPIELHSIPHDDSAVYDMMCAADTVGVFQIESRAQMSMLPRLKPRKFYDLVIEVAIVRPGPIQGNMVHPYLRRRNGLEKASYPDARVEKILGKTLGVPIFQEQAMRLAITLANFSPGEAERLRRAMAAWKVNKGVIEAFKEKIVKGMSENGYSIEFAETCLNQIKGFSEYGFPESHAASFALLAYASAWLKRYYPAEFACALLNSQPMGFYAPSQIVRDAQRHGVEAAQIDINTSGWDCSVGVQGERTTLRLGLRLIAGLREEAAHQVAHSIEENGTVSSIRELWGREIGVGKSALRKLASADAFGSMDLTRHPSHWEIQELPGEIAPLDGLLSPREYAQKARLPEITLQGDMFRDYSATGLSLRAHPLQFAREALEKQGAKTAESLLPKYGIRTGTFVSAAGLAIIRQRPGTARGVTFITLEDETYSVNLIIRPDLFEQYHKIITGSSAMLVHGRLERIGEVVYIDTRKLESIDSLLKETSAGKYFNKSYSY